MYLRFGWQMDAKSKWFWTILLVTRSHPHYNITTLFEENIPQRKEFFRRDNLLGV
jgi:hypothetical protein